MSLLDQIKNHKDLTSHSVDIWGVKLFVNQLSIKEILKIEKETKNKDAEEKMICYLKKMVTDHNSERVFDSPEGEEVLLSKSIFDLQKLIDVAASILNFSDKDAGDLQKK